MTALRDRIARRIRLSGPMSVAEYMAECLGHPEHGYYIKGDPLGASGDFITAPEISQMFGELLGLALAQAWMDQGAPRRFVLAEPGPGRGTLMADILRATGHVPGFHEAACVHLVETSPALRAAQAERLSAADPVWHERLALLPEAPLFLVANEYFDALPARQFIRRETGWAERVVGLGPDGALTFGTTEAAPLADLADRRADTADGDMVEISATRTADAAEIAGRIARHGGAALIVDYGDWGSLGDTLQAVSGHQPVGPLAAPGEADLTTHVDFAALARAVRQAGAAHSRLVAQGVFLERLGIARRAQTLAARLEGPALETHIAAHRRLTHPGEMGNLFKVMSIHPRNTPPPPGLTE